MIKLIVGNKGSGKTKTLVGLVNEATKNSSGNVVCVEKGMQLTYDIDHKARLIESDGYGIAGFESLYGFLTGVLAGNYDITDLFVDGTFKIGGRDYDSFAKMIKKLGDTVKDINIVFTVSCDAGDLPAEVKEYIA